jgi:hypothetical protein
MAMLVFIAVASAVVALCLVSVNRSLNPLLMFALIFGAVVFGTLYAFHKMGGPHCREFFDGLWNLVSGNGGEADEDSG